MEYRLIHIASGQFWKQPPETLSHVLTFRPTSADDSEDGPGYTGGDTLVVRKTAAEAATYELGAVYEVSVAAAP